MGRRLCASAWEAYSCICRNRRSAADPQHNTQSEHTIFGQACRFIDRLSLLVIETEPVSGKGEVIDPKDFGNL